MAGVTEYPRYPIGTPGTPWGDAEKREWLSRQSKQRDYFTDVVSRLYRLALPCAEVYQYGELDYRPHGAARFPLLAVRSTPWRPDAAMVVVTGGNHGYETSGVHGALLFVEQHFAEYAGRGLNVLVLPCLSPWGYEVIHRWTPEALDPNRQYVPGKPGCPEAAQAMAAIAGLAAESKQLLMHVDLHETTDTDNTEFTPALHSRNGVPDPLPDNDPIPDGFFIVADSRNPQVEFQRAMITAVEKVTHIAPPDEGNTIVGLQVIDRGVIAVYAEGVCSMHTTAQFTATTEVYPDSAKTNPAECARAQVAATAAGIEYALAHQE